MCMLRLLFLHGFAFDGLCTPLTLPFPVRLSRPPDPKRLCHPWDWSLAQTAVREPVGSPQALLSLAPLPSMFDLLGPLRHLAIPVPGVCHRALYLVLSQPEIWKYIFLPCRTYTIIRWISTALLKALPPPAASFCSLPSALVPGGTAPFTLPSLFLSPLGLYHLRSSRPRKNLDCPEGFCHQRH